jgi:hypothetical protein
LIPVVEQIAGALIALREAQYHIRQVQRLSPDHRAAGLDYMNFDIEKMAAELVKVAQLVQSSPTTR